MSVRTSKKLSTILGFYFTFSVIILTGAVLFFTYRLSIQTINTEVTKSFNQKHNIAENIFEWEVERLENNLQDVQNNQRILNQIYNSQHSIAQANFQKFIDKSIRHKVDVLFISIPDNAVWLDASSPVPDVKPILFNLANKGRSLLLSAKILRFKNETTDLTGIFKSKKLIFKNGQVMGVLIAGTILNNNLHFLNRIKHKTRSLAVSLIQETNILVSSDREGIMTNNEFLVKGFHLNDKVPMIYHHDESIGQLISNPYPIMLRGAKSSIHITFSTDDNVLETVKNAYLKTLVLISILFVLFLILSLITIKKLIYPSIERMLEYTKNIIQEETTQVSIQPGSITELNTIGFAMEKMVIAINETNVKLKESEAKYRRLTENSPDMIYRMSLPGGKYEYVSPASETIFGYSPEIWYENPILIQNIIHPDFHGYFNEKWDLLLKGEVPPTYEYQILYQERENRWIHQRNVDVRDSNGKLIAIEGIVTDITELKHMEEELRQAHKMESIGTISGGIAHDFNNILGIIIGNAELAVEDIPDWSPAQNNLKEIKIAGMRARDIVKQLLSFSRKTVQTQKNIRIHPIIKESIKLIRSSIPTTIDIHLNVKDIEGVIKADPTQIHQVLINMCTNAAHAMDDKGGILTIGLSEVELSSVSGYQFQDVEPGKYIQLTIEDTGVGIDRSIVDRVFDPYFTTKEVGKGSGMGLSVVHGIVKSCNGAISVYSEPGQGTTFKLLFPAAGKMTDNKKKSINIVPTGDEKILFVDDEKALAKLGATMLEQLGYTVVYETNSLRALDLIKAEPSRFDLIITDMTMPHLTGDQLSQKILKINPDMPIILCTGFSHKIDNEAALKMGIRRYIDKPINQISLATVIRKVLSESFPINS